MGRDIVEFFSLSDRLYSSDVSIEGFVLNPGKRKWKRGMTVFDLIFSAGGFDNLERLDNTYMDRADYYSFDKQNNKYDLYTFRLDSVLAGLSIAQKLLRMGDRIRIFSNDDILGSDLKFVEVSGYVKNPGRYQYASGMRLKDLLFLGSGYLDQSFENDIYHKRADLVRLLPDRTNRKIIKIDFADLLEHNKNNILINPGDRLIVYSQKMFQNVQNEVEISGEVSAPGVYQLYEDMRLVDLLLLAGGLKNSSEVYKFEISERMIYDQNNEQIANVTYHKFLNNLENYEKTDKNILGYKIKPGDKISVLSPSYQDYQSVLIEGEVNFPGKYTLKTKNDNLASLVKRAGGITDYANPDASIFIRNGQKLNIDFGKILKSEKSKFNINLIDGDSVIVVKKSNLVTIVGEVNAPGQYQYISNYDLNDYIRMAGSLTSNALKSKIHITYPNGSSKKLSTFSFSPKVLDGSKIVVPSKEKTEPFDLNEFISNLTTTYSNIVQVYAIMSIINQN